MTESQVSALGETIQQKRPGKRGFFDRPIARTVPRDPPVTFRLTTCRSRRAITIQRLALVFFSSLEKKRRKKRVVALYRHPKIAAPRVSTARR